MQEHIHSCPFCFHQHLSAMTKKGEDCCAAHTNTRHVAAGAAAASVDFVGHAAAAAGVNPYHNPCCSASCIYGIAPCISPIPCVCGGACACACAFWS